MTGETRFHEFWEPTLLEDEVLAKGLWWYDGEIRYIIVLKREKFDYTASDLDHLEAILHPVHIDYLDFAINSAGEVYAWYFEGPTGTSRSKTLSSLSEAKDHIQTYGRVDVRWHK
jgi:hypothetical protein